MQPSPSSSQNAQPNTLLVSIVVCSYNYARFLNRAIDSALNQTHQPVEVIVVDDGSTDKSREIIAAYGDRIRAVCKENGGQGSAYNTGFAASHGDLIHYLDADDFLDPAAISEVVRVWRPGISKVHFYLRMVRGIEAEPTEAVVPSASLPDGDVHQEILSSGAYLSPPASGNVYARSALAEILPLPEKNWVIGADTYPILLTPFLGPVAACPKVLGYYRIHDNNNFLQSSTVVRSKLTLEAKREDMLFEFCSARNTPYSRDALSKQLDHLKTRLASLSLDPANHPYPGDRPWPLAWKITKISSSGKGNRLLKKLLWPSWSFCLLCSPRAWRERLVDLAFVPTQRSRTISRFLTPAKLSRH